MNTSAAHHETLAKLTDVLIRLARDDASTSRGPDSTTDEVGAPGPQAEP